MHNPSSLPAGLVFAMAFDGKGGMVPIGLLLAIWFRRMRWW